jgi:hypothetical protein
MSMKGTFGRFAPLAIVAMAAISLACEEAPTALDSQERAAAAPELSVHAGNPVVLSARGSGHGVYEFAQGSGRRTFAFNAREHADGSVAGQIQMHNRSGDGNGLHGEIICINDWAANIVVLAASVTTYGTFTEGQIPNFAGGFGVFAVRDNGEGAGADPDQFTPVDLTDVAPAGPLAGVNLALFACNTPELLGFTPELVELLMLEAQAGNIQVSR